MRQVRQKNVIHAVFRASPHFMLTYETIHENVSNCQYHFSTYYNPFFSHVLFCLFFPDQHIMRYVLLKHEIHSDFHIDFMIDCGDERLLSWQIDDKNLASFLVGSEKYCNFSGSPNSIDATIYSKCQRIFDHRLVYLDFWGDLGEYRGHITRVECGTWELLELDARLLVIKTLGTRLTDNPVANSLAIRQWQFEPPVEIVIDPNEPLPVRLMQQLPPPGEDHWFVSCSTTPDLVL